MPKRILLADDSITIQKVVELTFSDGDYEVTAVNNGAKAVQKLGEMRPDIILSDIIMPEKNGYEVCEYVKSHPEYRTIPVVLLTGTFEPFDPDRAEKAGCDAVVTKPFESQSLIHKVEELIAQAQSAAAAPPAPPAPEPTSTAPPASPWMEDTPAAEPEGTSSPFTTSGGSFPTPPEAFTHGSDIFSAPPTPGATTEMPFETPADPFGAPPPADAFSSETRAFQRMSFDELQQMASEPPPPAPPPAAEPSPWDEQDFGGETRAFGKMSFEDLQGMAATPQAPPPAPEPEPQPESPFGAPPPVEEFSAETRAFQRMSFDELQQMASAAPEHDSTAPAPPPGGSTQAFPSITFEDLQAQMATPAPEPEPEPVSPAEASPWDEQPASGGETRAFPKMSFDDLQAAAPAAPEPAPWEEPSAPAWSPAADTSDIETSSTESFSTAAVPFVEPEDSLFAEAAPEEVPFEEPEAPAAPAAEPWTAAAEAEAVAEPEEPVVPPPVLAPEAPSIPIRSSDLSDDQIDRIARRVVELMSDQVVRNIAWEVIPDLAEMVVKERIRQLESEA